MMTGLKLRLGAAAGFLSSLLFVTGCPPEKDERAETSSECPREILHCVDDVVRCGGTVERNSPFYRQCAPADCEGSQACARRCTCTDLDLDGEVDCGPCEPTEVALTCDYDPSAEPAVYAEASDSCGRPQPPRVADGCTDDLGENVPLDCAGDEDEERCRGAFSPERPYRAVPGDASAVYTPLDAERWALCDELAIDGSDHVLCRCVDADPGLTSATYGNNRLAEVKDALDPRVREWARSVAIVAWRHVVRYSGNRFRTSPLEELNDRGLPLCQYGAQPTIANDTSAATAFLVAPDVVATAGHAINPYIAISEYAFVFDYQYTSADSAQTEFASDQVYFGRQVIARVEEALGKDWALVRLDRPVEGRNPLPIRRSGRISRSQSVVLLGHPWGTPLKASPGRVLLELDPSDGVFRGNWPSFAGMSGGPVINLASGWVEGIHVVGDRGVGDPPDTWVRSRLNGRACYAPRNCPSSPDRTRCALAGATSTVLFQSRVPRR